jgi:hypothetical protein
MVISPVRESNCWGTFEKIRMALPNVKFANATDVMQEVRSVKSAEEVAFIENAAEIIHMDHPGSLLFTFHIYPVQRISMNTDYKILPLPRGLDGDKQCNDKNSLHDSNFTPCITVKHRFYVSKTKPN